MTTDLDRAARRLGASANVAHGFVYFAPEAATAYGAIGLLDHQQYFASRAAPLGAASAATVEATFFNFAPHRVQAAIPSAWEVTTPAAAQQARLDGVDAVFARIGGIGLSPAETDEATNLLRHMIDGVDFSGKPLAAGNRDVDLPADPHLSLWQLATVIREWRGDAHNAVLTATPVGAVEALVLHAATGKVPMAALRDTRGWDEVVWAAAVASLHRQGLTEPDGSFTETGRAFRADIETRTDRACRPLVEAVGADGSARLTELLAQVGEAFSAAGLYALFTR